MRAFGVISTALSLVALAYAECNSRNQASSWENQTFINAGWRSPSSPLICQEIWNDTKAAPLQSVRAQFGIDRFSLQYWNCFLDSADGMSIPHVGYCVKAVPEQTALPSLPPPSTNPPKKPSVSQPLEPVLPPTASNLVTLWPPHQEASTAPDNAAATSSSTPRPSLTTLTDITGSNPVFDRLHKNTTLPAISGPSAPSNHSTWSTITVSQDSRPTAIDFESPGDPALTLGNVLLEGNQSDIAPYLPNFRANNTGFALACDDEEGLQNGQAEICHKTRVCDEEDELPTCEDGGCKCKPTFCSKAGECEDLNLCRPMDQMAQCDIGSNTALKHEKEGTCSCEPRHTDCDRHGMHSFCSDQFNCTQWSYDSYRLPVCVEDHDLDQSWCECKTTECVYSSQPNSTASDDDQFKGDNSTCGKYHCVDDWYFERPQVPGCKWDTRSSLNGTCGCKLPLVIKETEEE